MTYNQIFFLLGYMFFFSDVKQYNPVTDSTLESSAKKKGTKRRREETEPSVEVTGKIKIL